MPNAKIRILPILNTLQPSRDCRSRLYDLNNMKHLPYCEHIFTTTFAGEKLFSDALLAYRLVFYSFGRRLCVFELEDTCEIAKIPLDRPDRVTVSSATL